MSFNPDPTKQAQEVIFSRKFNRNTHPFLYFNNNQVANTPEQKHLGMILDSKLDFEEHLKSKLAKVSKTIGLLRKFQNILPRHSLLTIYKSFIRPNLDYGDIIYDQAYNSSFHQKLESIQYNACLAITGAIRGASREKLYQELGLEPLQQRRWYRKLCLFFKILNNRSPAYLFQLIPPLNKSYTTRGSNKIPLFKTKHNFFKNSFFPSTVIEWNKLDPAIRNSESFSLFKRSILSFIRPAQNSIFNCHNIRGIKLLTRLRVGLSHLREHKFKHNFQDSVNPLCDCSCEIETTSHFLLHCLHFCNERKVLLSKIKEIDSTILSKNDSDTTQILLYGASSFDMQTNTSIVNATLDFLIQTKRFDGPLM